MAMGARKAFQEIANESERDRWLKLPFTGCDGLPKTGSAWVASGSLPPRSLLRRMLARPSTCCFRRSPRGQEQPERALTAPSSIPPLAELKPKLALSVLSLASSSRCL